MRYKYLLTRVFIQHGRVADREAIMTEKNAVKILTTFKEIIARHHDEIHSAQLDWEKVSLSHPRYNKKIEEMLPIFVIDFK